MKLSSRERDILGCIEHQPKVTAEVLAKQLGMKAATVRYYISSLSDRGVIVGEVPFINLSRLGYAEHVVFFSHGAMASTTKSQLLNTITESSGVTWAALLGGEYQIAMSIATRSIAEIQQLCFKINSAYKGVFRHKAVSVRFGFVAFGRKYLAARGVTTPEFRIDSNEGGIIATDEVDQQILSALSSGKYRSQRQAAKSTAIPFATLDRRVQKLEKENVIAGYLYRYNLTTLSMFAYRILIQARGITKTLREKLYQYAKKDPHVIHFVECFGAWDYEFGVEVQSLEEINSIVDEINFQFGEEIERITTLQIFKHLKYSGFPFL